MTTAFTSLWVVDIRRVSVARGIGLESRAGEEDEYEVVKLGTRLRVDTHCLRLGLSHKSFKLSHAIFLRRPIGVSQFYVLDRLDSVMYTNLLLAYFSYNACPHERLDDKWHGEKRNGSHEFTKWYANSN